MTRIVLAFAAAAALSVFGLPASAQTITAVVLGESADATETQGTFATDTDTIVAQAAMTDAKAGTQVTGTMIAVDVGDAAAPNTAVLTNTVTLDDGATGATFTFSKPTNGWPVGRYQIDLIVNGAKAGDVPFEVQ